MASSKKEAQKYLGKEDDYINLKGLNNEKSLANQVYKTNTTSFQNAYNDLLSTIASNRKKANTSFSSGRSTINENAYLQNRNDATDLASRGLSGGLAQLNRLGNRMETGRQYSDLANTYYNTMNELEANERTGTNEYNTNMETAKNTLNAALADINAREKAGRNAYRAQVAQLAEQIQARRDAAAQAAAMLRATQANYKNQGIQAIQEALKGKSWAEASDFLVQRGLVKNVSEANKWLKQNTGLRPTQGGYSSPAGYGVITPKTNTTSSSKSSFRLPTASPTASALQNFIYGLWR